MLTQIGGFNIQITDDKDKYLTYDGPSLNYSNRPLKEKEIRFSPSSFLFQDSLKNIVPVIDKKGNNIHLLFPEGFSDKFVFDPFAASFYLVSRYEEYISFIPDKFGSCDVTSSFSFQSKILNRPLVNEWADAIKKQIKEFYPSLSSDPRQFTPVISIDIDQAYAFKYRGFYRNILSFIRNLIFLKKKLLSSQMKTIFSKNLDPFDTYEYLRQIQIFSQLPFIYFINVGNYSKFDKNLNTKKPGLQKLVNKLKEMAPVGLHPSYFSNEEPSKFMEEKKSLENLTSTPVTKSRQHYLKLKLPDTYRHLLKIGITEDYSMGYAALPGFRAGTCTPFNWFDVENNCATSLKVFPITFMEGTFGEDMNMKSDEALKAMNQFIEIVKNHNGYLLCIWHNHSVNDKFFWKGWKQIFEQIIKSLKPGY